MSVRLKQRASFNFKPFSPKSKKVINIYKGKTLKSLDGLICHGAVRSSKTFSLIISQVLYVNATTNRTLNLFGGITAEGIQENYVNDVINILKSIGFRVNQTGNIVTVTYLRNDGKFKKGNTNYFEIKGGDNKLSRKKIQGRTYYTIFIDEVAECDQGYVKMAISRLTYKHSKLFFACNPGGSQDHWFYKEYIAQAEEKRYLVIHFILDDNYALSEEAKDRFKRQFSGSFYDRMILGLWVVAEGLIYSMFSEKNIVKMRDIPKCDSYYIAGDYGTVNPMAWGLFGKLKNKSYLIKEYHHSGREEEKKTGSKKGKRKSDKKYGDDFDIFYKECLNLTFGKNIQAVIFDPSAASFKTELEERRYVVWNAKNTVNEGIALVANKIENLEFFVCDECIYTISEFKQYMWDEKALDNGKEIPLEQNDHHMDKTKYFHSTVMSNKSKVVISDGSSYFV